MRKTYLEWVEIVNNLAYDEVLVDMLSDWQADGLFRTDCINKLEARIAELERQTRPIEDALNKRIAELEMEVTKGHELQDALTARIAELSPAVGLMTTLKPTMVMDAEHPLEMAIEVVEHVTARIAELEAGLISAGKQQGLYLQELMDLRAAQRWIPVSEKPKVDGRYLLRNIYDDIYPAKFVAESESWMLGRYDTITHWMPLPTPPEVQE